MGTPPFCDMRETMQFYDTWDSPLGEMWMASDGENLCGLWFAGQKYFDLARLRRGERKELPVFAETKHWLAEYFSGKAPAFTPSLFLDGTPFQRMIWAMLLQIPYGETVTYGQLAARAAKKLGREKMSAQAVGSAVGHNPVSIIVPCHRVVGANGSLTGYAGGVEKKAWLLDRERNHI